MRHELGYNRHISASSISLCKGLPSRLRLYFLYFIFLLLICRTLWEVNPLV